MSAAEAPGLTLAKCPNCHARFVPADGPCPRCANPTPETYLASPNGTVLAATTLEVPPPGWEKPHLLALVELEDGVRLLVVATPPLPEIGRTVRVSAAGAIYRAVGSAPSGSGRGEGDAPGVGTSPTPL